MRVRGYVGHGPRGGTNDCRLPYAVCRMPLAGVEDSVTQVVEPAPVGFRPGWRDRRGPNVGHAPCGGTAGGDWRNRRMPGQ